MKTIKEKAEEYGYTNWQSDEYHDGASEGLPFDAIGHTQKMFEAGANYVLEKFVDIVNKNTKPNGMEDRAKMASDMLILIAQLKK